MELWDVVYGMWNDFRMFRNPNYLRFLQCSIKHSTAISSFELMFSSAFRLLYRTVFLKNLSLFYISVTVCSVTLYCDQYRNSYCLFWYAFPCIFQRVIVRHEKNNFFQSLNYKDTKTRTLQFLKERNQFTFISRLTSRGTSGIISYY